MSTKHSAFAAYKSETLYQALNGLWADCGKHWYSLHSMLTRGKLQMGQEVGGMATRSL